MPQGNRSVWLSSSLCSSSDSTCRGSFFEVITDHQPLVHLRHNPTNSARIERWLLIMNDYHFTITWRRGEANPVADALSSIWEQEDGPRRTRLVKTRLFIKADDA